MRGDGERVRWNDDDEHKYGRGKQKHSDCEYACQPEIYRNEEHTILMRASSGGGTAFEWF